MVQRLFAVALLAGLIGGLVATLTQAITVWPTIAQAEAIEHAREAAKAPPAAADKAAHDHDHDHEGSGIEATWFTSLLANVLVGLGFALLLMGCWVALGNPGGLLRGLAWGAGGFLSFVVAPALKLPPLPPGVDGGALLARQLIWIGTGGATAIGLMLLLVARRWWLRPLGLALIVLPHVLGAPWPLPAMEETLAALRPHYIAGLLGAAVLFWLALGGVAGLAWQKMMLR